MVHFSNEMFKCEHLSFDDFTIKQIQSFDIKQDTAQNLEVFLKEFALEDENSHTNRTYLVKDSVTHDLVCYFSLCNGLFTIESGDGSFIAIPAVELSNFAVNSAYKDKHPHIKKIGTITFKDFILPLVKYIQLYSGVQALYIYSLPNEKLMQYYSSLGFSRLNNKEEKFVHQHVKPHYDKGCIFMWQPV